MPVTPALWRLRQEGLKSEANLDYVLLRKKRKERRKGGREEGRKLAEVNILTKYQSQTVTFFHNLEEEIITSKNERKKNLHLFHKVNIFFMSKIKNTNIGLERWFCG